MLVKNSCEGTDETTVSVANSGGTSGTAWTDVTIVTGGTLVYDTAQAMHGTTALRHQTGATSGTTTMSWDSTVVGNVARLYGRFYLRLSTNGSARSLARVRNGFTQVMRIQMAAGGALEMRNTGNSVVATSSGTLAINTWYRIEYDCRPGTSQTNTIRVYTGDSTTVLFEFSGTGDFSSGTTVNEATFGNNGAAANLTAAWYDSMAASDTGWIGPETSLAVPVGDFGQVAVVSTTDTVVNKTVTGIAAGTVLVAAAVFQTPGGGTGTGHTITVTNTGPATLAWSTPANAEYGRHIDANGKLAVIKLAWARVPTAGDYTVTVADTGPDATTHGVLRVIPVTGVGFGEQYIVAARGASTTTLSVNITPAITQSLIIVVTADDFEQGQATYGTGWTKEAVASTTGVDITYGRRTTPPSDLSQLTFTTTAPTTGTSYNAVLLALPPVGGATVLSRAAGDTVTAGESVVRGFVAPRPVGESVALPETPARAVARSRAGADALTAGDGVGRAVARPVPLAEPVALTDSPTKATTAARSAGETFTLPDSNVRTIGRNRPVSEAVVLADSVQRGGSRPVAGADGISAADSVARASDRPRATADALTAGDSAARTSAIGKTSLDSVAATDSGTAGRAIGREASEPLTIIDTVVRAGGAARGGGEILSPVGTVARMAATARSAAGAVALVDNTTRTRMAAVALTDLAVFADAALGAFAGSRAAGDQITAGSSAVTGQAFAASVAGALSLAEQTVRRVDLGRSFSDTVTLVDDANAGVVAVRLVGGLVQMTEVATAGRSAAVTAAGSLAVSSNVLSAVVVHASIVSGTIALADTVSKGRALERGASGFLVIGEANERVVVLARARTDAVSLADAARKAREVARGVADQVVLADAAGGYVGDPATIIIASPHAVTVTSRPATVSDTTRRPSVRRTV